MVHIKKVQHCLNAVRNNYDLCTIPLLTTEGPVHDCYRLKTNVIDSLSVEQAHQGFRLCLLASFKAFLFLVRQINSNQ